MTTDEERRAEFVEALRELATIWNRAGLPTPLAMPAFTVYVDAEQLVALGPHLTSPARLGISAGHAMADLTVGPITVHVVAPFDAWARVEVGTEPVYLYAVPSGPCESGPVWTPRPPSAA